MRFIIITIIIGLSFASQHANINQPFEIKSQANSTISISFMLPDSTIQIDGRFSKISPNHLSRTTDEQSPDLPVFSKMYLMSPGKSYEFEVIINRSHDLTDIMPFPAKPLDDPASLDVSNFQYSDRDGVFPQQILKTSDPMIMRGNHVMQFSLIPFQYHFETNTLTVIDEAEIRITETISTDPQPTRARLRSKAMEPLLSSMLINYLPGDEDEYQQSSILYICGGNAITNPLFQSLLQWRREQGYVVYTAEISEIGSDIPDIENYIQTAYDTFSPPPEFIALVGDVGGAFGIPTYYENWSMCGYNEPCYGEGDYPYSQLEGDDILPEAFIGRISVRNNTSLSIVCNKTINYEKGLNAGEGWFEKASLAANPDLYGNGLSIVTTNEYIRDLMEANGVEDVTLNIQPNMAAISYWMNNQLSQGTSYLNFRGLYGPASFDIDFIMNDLQTNTMLPLVIFITCGTGSFAYESAAPIEQFLRSGTSPANYSGGVAAIGTATYGTHTPFNNIVDMGVFHGIYALGVETAGAALVAGELALFNTYPDNPANYVNIFTHWNNLMGDPALRLWTDTPGAFFVDHPLTLMPGSDYFTISVQDFNDAPVTNAVVSLLPENYPSAVSAITDDAGEARIPIFEDMAGTAKVTITKRNFFPYQMDVLIYPEGTIVELASPVNIDDQSSGNGNGSLDPGEIAQLTAIFMISGGDLPNGGDILITGTMAEILDNTCSFPAVGDGSTISCSFGLIVSPEASFDTDFQLTAHIDDLAGNAWEILIPVNISGCQLHLTETQTFTSDDLIPGSEVTLNLSLENVGIFESGLITGELHSADENAAMILSGGIEYNSIFPGMDGESTIDPVIWIPDYAIWGSFVDLQLSLETETGAIVNLTIPVNLSESTIAEPVGPDDYGYYIYGNEDRYSLVADYLWMEIDPEYGGYGTPLQMIDCGEGIPYDQDAIEIDLPFIFQFYGEEYSSISVSTNGWLSFGSTDLVSFRNTPVPGAGGPSPMVAVFWDDLKTMGENGGCNGSPYGGVFYFEEPTGKYVILEWSDVRTAQNNDIESFQVILYNTSDLTPTGDGELQFQYKVFNNTSNGQYLPEYNGLIHGSYSTIGLEDHTESGGLQYTFNNIYDELGETLQNESSLFITTRYPQNLFTAGTTIGVPPLTVIFEASDTGGDIVHEWDVDGDDIIDGTGDVFEWTYEDYGHYTVTMNQIQDGLSQSEYQLNYIHVVSTGCTDPIAENYDPSAEFNDGSCMYIYGCLDPSAANYNDSATMDSENCFYMPYVEFEVPGIYFNAYFGSDVDLEGDLAVVGAYNDSTGGMMSTGAAYIFKRDSGGVWDLVTKLTAFDSGFMDYYGFSVDISGDRVAIGSYQDDNERGINVGAVYVYREDDSGVWSLEEKIVPFDGELSDNFGYSVKLKGNHLASTSRKDDIDGNSNQGSVYFYQYSDMNGWEMIQYVTPVDGDGGDSFGHDMDINDQFFLVSSPLADTDGQVNTGKVYLYENDGSTPWVPIVTILPIDVLPQDQFGASVSISDNYMVMGSPNDDNNDLQNSGSVYIYRNLNDTWIFDDFLTDENGDINENFGKNLAIGGDYISIHGGNKIILYHRESNGLWQKTSGFESPVVGPMIINENRIITGNMTSNSARIYLLDEWDDWLTTAVPGDLNNDTLINVLDVVMMVAYIMGNIELSGNQLISAELSGDGIIDVLDIVILVELIL